MLYDNMVILFILDLSQIIVLTIILTPPVVHKDAKIGTTLIKCVLNVYLIGTSQEKSVKLYHPYAYNIIKMMEHVLGAMLDII